MAEVSNPYAPPTADELPRVRAQGFEYQPSEGLAVALRILLGVTVAVLLINVGALMMQIELLERAARGAAISHEEATANDQRVLLTTGGFLLAMLGSCVVWCIWQSRISKNVRALGGGGMMRFGPNAWGWFFCPVVNLWRPLSVVTEIWESAPLPGSARAPELLRADSPPSWLLGGWWIPWVVGNLISRVADRIIGEGNELDALINGSRWQLAAYGITAVSGVFAIVLVTMLHSRVEARRAVVAQTKGLA